MTVIQIPPSGIPANFDFEIPAPEGMSTLGGVRMHCVFALARPDVFALRLRIDGVEQSTMDSAMGPKSITRITQFQQSKNAPVQARLSINEGGSLQQGNSVTVYAWGAQTESGVGALNPDEGGNPSSMTDTIELGTVEVIPWQEWNRLTGANQGEEGS